MDSWRFRRRRTGLLVRSTGACLSGTCRDDPIPPGVYWIDIFYDIAPNGVSKNENFQFWLLANQIPAAPSNRVTVLKTVFHAEEDEPGTIPYTRDPLHEYPARDWILFKVNEPINRWGIDTGLGFPTVSPKGIETSEEDTIQSPPVPGFWDSILPESKLGKAAVITAAVAATGLVLYGLTRS